MLAPSALAIVAVAVLASSFVSGIFGMAGGMILLGVLLIFLDVVPAMVLMGVIQMTANGWRAALWYRYVDWPIVCRFLVGSTLVFFLIRSMSLLPSKATLYLTLGLLPFAADLVPKRLSLDITRPGVPYFAGALIIVLQLLAGAVLPYQALMLIWVGAGAVQPPRRALTLLSVLLGATLAGIGTR